MKHYETHILAIHEAAVSGYLAAISDKNKKAASPNDDLYQTIDRVALVRARGYVEKYPYAGSLSTIAVKRAMQAAAKAKNIDAIVLAIDSPGGGVSGLGEAGDAIYAARQVKPVIAQVDGQATSAAYWLASQASKIYAARGDIVGSIGVRMLLYDYSEMFKKEGVEPVVIDTGAYKSAGAQGTEITEAQKEDFQRTVDFYYGEFLNAIKRGRNMADKDLNPLADGRVFTGVEAMENGLIDGIQYFQDTLNGIVGELRTARARSRLAAHDFKVRLSG